MLNTVRRAVQQMLLDAPSFRALPPAQQQAIAHDTVALASYLAAPEGIPGNTLPSAPRPARDPYALQLAGEAAGGRRSRTDTPESDTTFRAQAAMQGAEAAGAYLSAVDFPAFVAGLIKGVFHAIVQSSIEQMEAYGRLVADVSKTLNQFRDENVSPNQGRDWLVETFPDTFQLHVDTGEDGGPAPRVRLREGADESVALARLNELPIEGGPIKSLDDDVIEERLVPAAQTQLATSRQQLLATMVLMGINRIVVTDGRIAAKVLFDFQARDNFRFAHSATKFDYADQYKYASAGEYESDYQGGNYTRDGDSSEYRGASYYSKGAYKSTAEPMLKLASATQSAGDSSLVTRANLTGQVDINFKSDYLALDKMADSFQIGRIQEAAKPRSAARAPVPAAAPSGGTTVSAPAP
jgi:hypothetical protein